MKNRVNWDPNALYSLLSPGKNAIADSVYNGEPTKVLLQGKAILLSLLNFE